ncbi:MAG: hypothetical protein ACRD0D_14635 [Acidimicrobiales bacterium]
MANLYVICRSCGRQFHSGVDAPLTEPTLGTRPHHCFFCGAVHTYRPAEYLQGYSFAEAYGGRTTSHH